MLLGLGHHLQAWLAAARIENGPLFRRVNRHGQVGGQLDQGSVSSIFKAMARRARLSPDDVTQISGTPPGSARVRTWFVNGADIAGAMQAGRWQTTTMVSRYCAELEIKRGAVAQVAARREQFV
jgi:hypothetical protein